MLASIKKVSRKIRNSQINKSNSNLITRSLGISIERIETTQKELLLTQTTSGFCDKLNLNYKIDSLMNNANQFNDQNDNQNDNQNDDQNDAYS